MSESNTNPISFFDEQSAELHPRITNGLVNNFCCTIIHAIHCNTDIKFIGSGTSAKAILYYITDYITKSQLKTNVAYSAIQATVKHLCNLSTAKPNSDITQAKKVLLKSANAVIGKQELGSQQVASYLLGFKDYYTGHQYHSLFWSSFVSQVNKIDPLEDSPTLDCVPDFVHDSENIDNNEDHTEFPEAALPDVIEQEDDVFIDNNVLKGLTVKGSQVMDYIFRDHSDTLIACVFGTLSLLWRKNHRSLQIRLLLVTLFSVSKQLIAVMMKSNMLWQYPRFASIKRKISIHSLIPVIHNLNHISSICTILDLN